MAVVDWRNETAKRMAKQVKKEALRVFENHELHKESEHTWHCFRRYQDDSKWKGKYDSSYHFRVAFLPGHVVLVGDLGSMILCHSGRDSLSWLRGSVENMDYVLGKLDGGYSGVKARKRLYDGDVNSAFLEEINTHWNDASACYGPEDAEEDMDDGGPHVFDFTESPEPGDRSFDYEDVRPCTRCKKEFKICAFDKAREVWLHSKDDDENAAWTAYNEATGDVEFPFEPDWDSQTLWQYWALAWFCQLYDPRQD